MFNNYLKKISALMIIFSFLFLTLVPTPVLGKTQEKISFIYLYGGSTQDYINQYQKTGGAIDIVSPNFFDVDTKGDLVVNVNPTLINYMHQQGVKVIPFLSNHWDRSSGQLAIATPEKRAKLANELTQAVILHNLDGINIDFENLTYADKDSLTAFTALLRAKLKPLGKNLSIAVGSVDRPLTTGWKSVYDLANLSKQVDYVVVMAYDQHWNGGNPGPVAALPWVEKQVQYMLTQIPNDKFVLGVPFYGRVWTDNKNGVGSIHSHTLKEAQVNNASISWHSEHKVPFVKYTRADGAVREIWFEDARSLEEKIKLITKYDLAGVGAWRLGQEDVSLWQGFSTWLNGRFFVDMVNHWAEKDVLFLSNKGIIAGRNHNHYDPNAPVTRAEAVAILSRIFSWELSKTNPFIDVSQDFWALKPILGAYQHGIIAGIETNKFGPQNHLTRGQLAVLLQRAFQFQKTDHQGHNFTDVPENYWAAKEIQILNSHGLLGGRTENHFVPDGNITRAELAALVARVLK